jgi:hypothetical protein
MGKAKRQAEKAAKSVLGAKPASVSKAARRKAAAAMAAAAGPSVTGQPSSATQTTTSRAKAGTRATNGEVAKPSDSDVDGRKRLKSKPLVLCARGITYRYRHLMTDLMQLVPHHKADSKLDTKHDWQAINEIAELKVRLCGRAGRACPGHTVSIGLASRSAAGQGACW